MQMTTTGALSASILMLLLCRFFFGAALSRFQSRKARKRYKADVSLWDRWFLLSAPHYVQDKYSKLERKIIKAKATIRAMRAMNLLLHILLTIETLTILLVPTWCNIAFPIYFSVWSGILLLSFIIDWCNHANAERVRCGRKPPNW